MGYWKHHVEEMDEIIEENLPDEWKKKLMEGEISLIDIPSDIQCEAFQRGEADYWGSQIDAAMKIRKGEKENEAIRKMEKADG
jgi:hypothetical protein